MEIQDAKFNDCFQVNEAKSRCLEMLKNAHVRMSKQRIYLVDLLFSGSYTCVKDLFYEAQSQNPELGISTVYRFLKVLEDIGAISNNHGFDMNKCQNCDFKVVTVKDSGGKEIRGHELDLSELLRLGLIVKGVINSNEKIDVKMVDDLVDISVKDK